LFGRPGRAGSVVAWGRDWDTVSGGVTDETIGSWSIRPFGVILSVGAAVLRGELFCGLSLRGLRASREGRCCICVLVSETLLPGMDAAMASDKPPIGVKGESGPACELKIGLS